MLRSLAHTACLSVQHRLYGCIVVTINNIALIYADCWRLLGLDDARRPWVGQEKERFKALLQANGLPIQEHRYFDGVEPTLLMHFEAIQAMQRLN